MVENMNNRAVIPQMPTDPRYAYAYIKYQCLDKVFDIADSLEKGTAFPELFMPYKYMDLRGGDIDDNE